MKQATISRGAKFRRDKIAGIRWFARLAFYLYAYWFLMSNFVIQNFWDPQYAYKLERLHARTADYPGHPLWLVLGSSRVQRGVRTDLLVDRMRNDKDYPLIFNFGLGGAGMFRQYICLQRLLEAGIKPQRVGIEIGGASMSKDVFDQAAAPMLLIRARQNEFDDFIHQSDKPSEFIDTWYRSRWDPTFRFGMKMEHQTLAWRLIPVPGIKALEKTPYDKWGWDVQPSAPIDPDFYRMGFNLAKSQFQDKFVNFKISPRTTDWPLRRMLEMCKGAGIDVFLFKMPEGKDFQAFYTPEADAAIADYLAKIQIEYNVPIIDARSWIGREGFTDGHHLDANGAADFTLRFADELMAAWKTRQPH